MKVRAVLAIGAVLMVGLLLGAPAAQAGGGGCHMTDFTDQQGIQVDLKGACFIPTLLRVQPGQTVTFANADEMTHTVTGAAGSWGTYDELQPHASVTYRFASSGVYPYFCVIHPGMTGAVIVGDGTYSKTTTQAAVVAVLPSVPPSQAAPLAAPGQSVVEGVSSAWRTAAIVAFGALLAMALTALARMTGLRRRRAAAGV
jgi:plastocyanin